MGIYRQYYEKTKSTYNVGYETKNANVELLKKYAKEVNIAESIDDKFLYQLGVDLEKQINSDDSTRQEWFDKYNEALDIAKQKIKVKEYPFEKCANVLLPLILEGCVQFNARIMPEIIQNNKTVYVDIVGQSTLDDEAKAERISNHMSLQTMHQVDNWVSDTDKLLFTLALVGSVFRKWTYDPISRKPASYLCLPTEIIVSNDVPSLEKAERITHVIRMSRNEIIERIKFGLFREDCLNDLPLTDESANVIADVNYSSNDDDKQLPSEMVESRDNYLVHETACFIDLDNDGYCEPYTVTRIVKNRRIARIAPRYDEKDLVFDANGKLIRINAKLFYAHHYWLPSPDGSFLGMGLGQLLLPLNQAANTTINQLLDAGTLSNLPAGFLSKDLRMKKGELQFSAGEWRMVNFNVGMGNLSNHVYPLPFKEPSQVLFSLLQYLVNFGKEVANISDVLMGNPSNANMPATSVVSLIEQGSKVFSSILTRLYESLRKEFNILYNINKKYFSLYPEKDLMTQTGFVTEQDYADERFNIYPVANPAMGMDAVRLAKLQTLMQIQSPLVDQKEVLRRYFIALGMPNVDKLFTPPEVLNQPSPQALLMQAQMQEVQAKAQETQLRTAKLSAEIAKMPIDVEISERELQLRASAEGGKLAIGQGNVVANIAKSEALGANKQQVAEAENVADDEMNKSQIPLNTTGIDQKVKQFSLNLQQNSGNMDQNQAENMQGGGQQGQTNVQNAPKLPPELLNMLQQISQEQK
jgi:hypothetical protein